MLGGVTLASVIQETLGEARWTLCHNYGASTSLENCKQVVPCVGCRLEDGGSETEFWFCTALAAMVAVCRSGLECRGSFLRVTRPPSYKPPCGQDPAEKLDFEHVSARELLGIEEPKVEHGGNWIRAETAWHKCNWSRTLKQFLAAEQSCAMMVAILSPNTPLGQSLRSSVNNTDVLASLGHAKLPAIARSES